MVVNLFGRGQAKDDERLAALERRAAALESALRTLENEQVRMHDQVHKWMRRAVAAERNQERREVGAAPAPAATPAPPRPPAVRTGASLRSYTRRLEQYTSSLARRTGNYRGEDLQEHEHDEAAANGNGNEEGA